MSTYPFDDDLEFGYTTAAYDNPRMMEYDFDAATAQLEQETDLRTSLDNDDLSSPFAVARAVAGPSAKQRLGRDNDSALYENNLDLDMDGNTGLSVPDDKYEHQYFAPVAPVDNSVNMFNAPEGDLLGDDAFVDEVHPQPGRYLDLMQIKLQQQRLVERQLRLQMQSEQMRRYQLQQHYDDQSQNFKTQQPIRPPDLQHRVQQVEPNTSSFHQELQLLRSMNRSMVKGSRNATRGRLGPVTPTGQIYSGTAARRSQLGSGISRNTKPAKANTINGSSTVKVASTATRLGLSAPTSRSKTKSKRGLQIHNNNVSLLPGNNVIPCFRCL